MDSELFADSADVVPLAGMDCHLYVIGGERYDDREVYAPPSDVSPLRLYLDGTDLVEVQEAYTDVDDCAYGSYSYRYEKR